MNEIRNALGRILRNDPILEAYLGRDERNQPKVYEMNAPKDLVAPYVTWFLIAGGAPEGLYHDDRALETKYVQINAWGRTADQAWDLYTRIQEALDVAEWNVYLTPYNLLRLIHTGDQRGIPDITTGYIQVPCTYRLVVGR